MSLIIMLCYLDFIPKVGTVADESRQRGGTRSASVPHTLRWWGTVSEAEEEQELGSLRAPVLPEAQSWGMSQQLA